MLSVACVGMLWILGASHAREEEHRHRCLCQYVLTKWQFYFDVRVHRDTHKQHIIFGLHQLVCLSTHHASGCNERRQHDG